MKKPLLLAICLAMLTGCSGQGSDKTPADKSKGTIGVSLLTLDNPFFKVIGDNIASEGKKQGYRPSSSAATRMSPGRAIRSRISSSRRWPP